jgi:cation:H+ antiporter
MGQALIGLLLLGGVTSLPEMAVAVSASLAGAQDLAVNSVLGGVAMQVAILALADAMIGRHALTSVIPDPTVMLQAALKIIALATVTAALVVGDTPVLGAGLWMWLLAAVIGGAFWILSNVREDLPWRPNDRKISKAKEDQRAKEEAESHEKSLQWAVQRAALAGLAIVVAGYVLSNTGEAIAEASGLGESFVGVVLVAISTSLPEVSTVFGAVRAGLFTMAMSDIFGTNLFDLALLFLIDLLGGSDAVMNSAGPFETFAALVGITVTAIFILGLAERRDRTIFRMGYDSFAVALTYLGGLIILFFLR